MANVNSTLLPLTPNKLPGVAVRVAATVPALGGAPRTAPPLGQLWPRGVKQ
jgi:hypothetical protein